MSKQLRTDFKWNSDFKQVKTELSKISSSFCLAKWLQSTIHFQLGTTHSCHHLLTHKITPDDIKNSHTGIHNTSVKLNERALMLSGVQPDPCNYCWNIENSNPDAVSDRILKSSASWAYPHCNDFIASNLGENISPTYLEVSFSNLCNFKCSYCSADYSSKWQNELETLGNFSTRNGEATTTILKEETNLLLNSFWKWWPELKKHLHIFRITGGEPLLSPATWNIFDDLSINPAPNLQLAINSNLGVPTNIIKKFIEHANSLINKKNINEVRLFTSLDTLGVDAELSRNGLNQNLFFENLNLIMEEVPSLRIVIMVTYNAFSVNNFTDLLKKIYELRGKYLNDQRWQPIGISSNYLRHPEHLSIKVLPERHLLKMEESLNYMKSEFHDSIKNKQGYFIHEINSLSNIIDWFKQPIDANEKKRLQANFLQFWSEHDQRRGTHAIKRINELNLLNETI